jgi:hypothetical protein
VTYWPRRPVRAQPKEVRSPSLAEQALAEMKAHHEEEAPFGGWGGEMIMPRAPEPPPITWEPALVIEKPDWDQEHREFEAREREAREAEFQAELKRREEQALLEEEPGRHPPPTRTAS